MIDDELDPTITPPDDEEEDSGKKEIPLSELPEEDAEEIGLEDDDDEEDAEAYDDVDSF